MRPYIICHMMASLDGKKLLSNAHNLKGLAKGTYIVNREKVIIQ